MPDQREVQAFQESGFDNSAKSSAGAIGVMQLLPSTAKDMGFDDISNMENNIHAGVKYMAYIRDTFIEGKSELHESDFYAFLWCTYNAGPGRLRQLRSHATTMELDSTIWFGNVEYATLAKVGHEPVNYVSRFFKYFQVYSSAAQLSQVREGAGG